MDSLTIVGNHHFRINRYQLNKHFSLRDWSVSVLSQPRLRFAQQLLLKSESQFDFNRVPLYICRCGDIFCGAVTVKVELLYNDEISSDRHFRWSEFAWQLQWALDDPNELSQTEFMQRTGPFEFDEKEYRYALSAYA